MSKVGGIAIALLVVGIVVGVSITFAVLPPHTSTEIMTSMSVELATSTITVTGDSTYTSYQTATSTQTLLATSTVTATATITTTVFTTVASSTSTIVVDIPQGAGSGSNFSPSTLTVAPGSTIVFMDEDSVAPHNVWFTSVPSGAANPNTVAGEASGYTLVKGDAVSYTLTTPGTYDYECQFHSTWMQGTITIS